MKVKPQKKRAPKAPKKITKDYLRNAGLYYLGRFAASRARFLDVMHRKIKKSCAHHTDQNIDDCYKMAADIADDFERAGLLNDAQYARGMITTLRRSGKSRRSIEARMAARGITGDIVKKTMDEVDGDDFIDAQEAESAAAMNFAKKKKLGRFGNGKRTPQQDMAIFARAGFSYGIAQQILGAEDEE
jgi:regulatory protein